MSYEENVAMIFVKEHEKQKYTYLGNNQNLKDKSGYFFLLEDKNCCAPTHDLLFGFNYKENEKIMKVDEFLDFVKDCEPEPINR